LKQKSSTNGFTLLEVLVAMVIAGLLTAILMGAVSQADTQYMKSQVRAEKFLVAETILSNAFAERKFASDSGTENGIAWELSSTVIASDPRGTINLINVKVSTGSDDPVLLERRVLVDANIL
jgi:prepilin-type N-terminal cleavage/methylation domain-containing protein